VPARIRAALPVPGVGVGSIEFSNLASQQSFVGTFVMSPVSFQSRAVGVPSKGEDPVTAVRSADGGSRNAIPRHVIPERGQIPENGSPHTPP
jgi:hypothetical protein